MDARQFLAEFGHIADASPGVARLRELILQLAISGRLVERNTPETPVSESLAAASKQRELYVTEQGLRPALQQPEIYSEPFVIPEHWVWVRLEQLALVIQRGKSPKYADAGTVRVVSQKCVQWSGFDLRQARPIADDSVAAYGKERFLCEGDVLWNSTGTGTAGRVGIYRNSDVVRVVADSHVTVIRLTDTVLPRYLWCVIASPWVQARVQPSHPDSLVSGTTQQVELATNRARALAIPCPPVEEQARIIAKVDELMSLCDKLEVQQQARRRLQNSIRQFTLQAVAEAVNTYEFRGSWVRLAENFGSLFTAPEDVAQLRDVIFDLGLRGVFLPKAKTPVMSNGELPPLPANWEWKTLSSISEYITSGSRGWKAYLANTGDAFIRSQDIKHDALIFENPAYVSLPAKVEGKRTLVQRGDLLLTITGANVAKCAVVPELTYDAYVSQHVALIRLIDPMLSEFIHFWMTNTCGGRGFLSRYIYGDKPGLNLAQVGSVPIPVPTDEDRDLILDRLRGYQKLCDRFTKNLKIKQALSAALAQATIASLTGIGTEQERNEPVKPPQTELIAPLRLGQLPDVRSQAPLATILARHDGEMSARDLWQRFGGEIADFYAQLKTEVGSRWILEPEPAEMREVSVAAEVA